jgi:hypothetical protein
MSEYEKDLPEVKEPFNVVDASTDHGLVVVRAVDFKVYLTFGVVVVLAIVLGLLAVRGITGLIGV